MIAEVLDSLIRNPDNNADAEAAVREKVLALCGRFPIYPSL